MTAEPLLKLAAKMFARHRLDAVLIGNAAAALQGAPVTTVDLDFLRGRSRSATRCTVPRGDGVPERKKAPARTPRRSTRAALRRESERARIQQIRTLLAKPMRERVWFLRSRLRDGSAL